jgi:hypothetical protein
LLRQARSGGKQKESDCISKHDFSLLTTTLGVRVACARFLVQGSQRKQPKMGIAEPNADASIAALWTNNQEPQTKLWRLKTTARYGKANWRGSQRQPRAMLTAFSSSPRSDSESLSFSYKLKRSRVKRLRCRA